MNRHWESELGNHNAAPPPVLPTAGGADAVELAHLWTILRSNRRFVLAVALLIGCAVMVITLASRMTFKATSRLYLGEINGSASAAPATDLVLAGGAQGAIPSEIEILRSRSLVTKAALQSGLNVGLTREGQSQPRYLTWLVTRRDPRLLDPVFSELRVENVTFIDVATREPQKYSVRFRTAGDYDLYVDERILGAGKLGDSLKTAELSLTLLKGAVRSPAPGARYDLIVRPLGRVIEEALDALEITTPKPSATSDVMNVLTLEFRDSSPRRAAMFLDELMRAYLDARQAWKTEDASAAEAFVTDQLSTMRGSLDGVQQKLADYKSKNDVIVLGKEAEAMVQQIGKYEEQRLAARLQVASLQEAKRALSGPNPPMGAFLIGEANDSVLESMAQTLSDSRSKLADLEARFSDAAPDVREQRARVEAQLAAIRNYIASRLSRAQENLASMSAMIRQYEDKLKTVPGAEFGLAQLSRESEVYSKTYSYLLERQQQAGIVKASTLSKNRVLDPPQVPLREDSPRLLLRLASILAGLFVGVALVVVRSISSGNFQTESDVQRGVAGVPIFGSFPRYRDHGGKLLDLEAPRVFSALLDGRRSPFAESIRVLRASLRYWVSNDHGAVILVTSPRSGDGKTTLVLSLGAALAAEGRRVLVLDADMSSERPTGGEEALLPRTLASVLSGGCPWRDAVRDVSLLLPNLFVVDAGGPTPPEALSQKLRTILLDAAREAFDFVLIDAPSFPASSDALSWAELADGVISIVRIDHTPRKLASAHLGRLSAFANAFAILVNDAGPAERDRMAYPKVSRDKDAEEQFFDGTTTWFGIGDGSPSSTDPDVQVHTELSVLDGGGPTSKTARRVAPRSITRSLRRFRG